MTRPIIVAMDLSKASLVALEEAIVIARRRGAEIVMLHVTPMPDDDPGTPWANPGIVKRYQELLKDDLEDARKTLHEIRDRFVGRGAEISLSLASGDPERAIGETAKELDAQLIIVGSHGRKGLDRFLLGSVAERVSRFTDRDVLVARGTQDFADYDRVLVATDFSGTADLAYEAALTLAAPDGHITLLHCVEVPPAAAGFVSGEILVEVEQWAQKRAERLAQRGRDKGFHVEFVISSVYPPVQIRELAANHSLVVMGSHGRRGFRRYLLGSVAEKTIRHAPCSVYIARAPGQTGDAP